MRIIVKTISILMLTFFLAAPCYTKKVHIIKRYPTKSVPMQLPVEADLDDDTSVLTIQFLENMGNVSIEIKSSSEDVVYYDTVEATASSEVTISLAGTVLGNCQLIIVEENKTSYIGDFELY